MNSPREYTSDIIDQIDQSGDKIRRARLPKRMRIAYKIANAIAALDLKNKDLTEKLGKKYQSQITKWLKGDHNFTVNTLSDIEEILDIELLTLDEGKKKPLATKMHVTLDLNSEQSRKKIFATEHDKVAIDAFVQTYVAFAGGLIASKVEVPNLM